jgi:ATP-binding cassette, subfamily B (MDR/TAP), member 1
VFWYGGQLVSRQELGVQSFFLIYIAIIFGGQGAGFIFGYSSSKLKTHWFLLESSPNHRTTIGITKAQAAVNRMLYMKSRKPNVYSPPQKELEMGLETPSATATPAITFHKVQFRYPTRPEVAVLKGLSFDVLQGENICIVGPSGSGKSTIIALLERFYEPTAGIIVANGKKIHNQDVEDYRSSLGLVSQETHLYQGSIRDNLLLGVKEKDVDDERLFQVCKDSNIHDFIVSLPESYNTNIGPRGLSLSGGQRQRIAIARALLRNPQILLLDEATSALDPESQTLVMEALERVGKGRTTISVTHHMEMVKRADKVLVIENGRVVESGTYEELVRMRGRFWEMAGELMGQE